MCIRDRDNTDSKTVSLKTEKDLLDLLTKTNGRFQGLHQVFKDALNFATIAETKNLNQNNKNGYICQELERKTREDEKLPYHVYGEEDVLVLPPIYDEKEPTNNQPSVAVIKSLKIGGELEGKRLRIIHQGGEDGVAIAKVEISPGVWREVKNWNIVVAGHPDADPKDGIFTFKNGKTYALSLIHI